MLQFIKSLVSNSNRNLDSIGYSTFHDLDVAGNKRLINTWHFKESTLWKSNKVNWVEKERFLSK